MAFLLPEIPSKLTAAIFLAGASILFVAARRSDNRFERLVAAAFGVSIIWAAYLAAIRGTRGGGQVHSISWFTLMTVAVVLVVGAMVVAAVPMHRVYAVGLLLIFGREWWDSLSSLVCGNLFAFRGCRVSLHMPDVLSLLLVVAGLVLMIVAAATSAAESPSRWVLFAIAASELWDLFFVVIAVLDEAPQLRVVGLVNLLGFGASLAFALRAMQERARQATALLGMGLAVVALPAIWSGMRYITVRSGTF